MTLIAARVQERGLRIKRHNEKVRSSGIGVLLPERATDTVPEVARERYRTFVAHYKTIEKLKQVSAAALWLSPRPQPLTRTCVGVHVYCDQCDWLHCRCASVD